MGEQLGNHAVALGWQACQHIFQIGIRIMPVELGTLDQTHDGRTTLAGTQLTGEQPIIPADGNRANLILDMVVIDRQLPTSDETRQRAPASETVIQCFGRGRAIRNLLTVQNHPLLQGIEQWF